MAIAWMFAMKYPQHIKKLSIMEGILGNLKGAEAFLAKGQPWWFGFHGVPNFAENVLKGNEATYIDWFLKAGTKNGVGLKPYYRDAFVNAYSSSDAMRCGFKHYRAFPENTQQINEVIETLHQLPILAIAGGVVGTALAGQLRPIFSNLVEKQIPNCAHLIPLEQPDLLAEQLNCFFKS